MANKIYLLPETASLVDWTDDGTGGDETLDVGGLVADGVREGDRHDFGAAARSEWWEWRMVIDGFDADDPVPGETIDLYWASSDGVSADGGVGTTDGAGAASDLPNLQYLGSCIVQVATQATQIITSGRFQQLARYGQPVVHNNTADTLLGTSDAHHVLIIPVPPESQ